MNKNILRSLLTLSICLNVIASVCLVNLLEDRPDQGRQMMCRDTRDGDQFSFNTDNISRVRISFDGLATFKIVDDIGTWRFLHSTLESSVKCKRVDNVQ